MIFDTLAFVSVLVTMVALLTGLAVVKRKWNMHPEVPRKVLHVLMGCVCLTFPSIFQHDLTVAALALVAGTTLFFMKKNKTARATVGDAFCAIDRQTYGELCFPAAVAILFAITHDNLLLYYLPVMILTISDALSAVIGIFHGKKFYSTRDGRKTVEGSLAFFASAAALSFVAIATFGGVPLLNAVLIACIMASLVTAFEAIAWRGLDNLFIPLSAYAFLKTYLPSNTAVLQAEVVISLAMFAFAMYWRKRTTLDDSAAMGAALFCFICWSIGGIQWLLPPLTLFACYSWFLPRVYREKPRHHSIITVLVVASVGFAWLFLSQVTGNANFVFPYIVTYAVNMTAIAVAHAKNHLTPLRRALFYGVILKASALLFVPYLIFNAFRWQSIFEVASALLLLLSATIVFHLLQRKSTEPPTAAKRWVRQLAVSAAASAAVFAIWNYETLAVQVLFR